MKRLGILIAFLIVTTTAFAQAPTVGSVVNAGSYAFAGLPNSPIAQGALFVVFGTNMGPATIQKVSAFPLQTTLAGTSISVTVNGTTTQALFIYTSAGQVAAILPSRTPVGTGTLTVSYNGQTSAPLAIQVVQNNFGSFTWNNQGSGAAIILDGNFQLITALHPAAPNQVVALWGTGVGPYTGDETNAPVQADMTNIPVEVYVGTTKATITYRGRTTFVGVDQINFQIPPGQLGCNVSVTVKIGSFVSNTTTMAVSNSGVCSDPSGISSDALQLLNSKGNISIGSVALSRSNIQIALPPPLPSQNTTTESGSGAFYRFNRDQFLSSVNAGSSVSTGGCIVSTFQGQSAASALGSFTGLDAGAAINLSGPNGSRQIPKVTQGGFNGFYSATLATGTQPSYLTPGSYTISGAGGADVGAFQTSVPVGSSLNWLNQSSISTVNRSQDLPITWSGGGSGFVTIVGSSTAGTGTATFGATFICLASASAGQFTVPSIVLLALPPSSQAGGGGFSIPTGFLFVGSSASTSFTAPGLDQGFAVYSDSTGKTVNYQ